LKRIGLLGGMSWESTTEYNRLVNERRDHTSSRLWDTSRILF
jgi:aspartate/glutamate racemase